MTLPKASTLIPVDFNQFDAMSFPANINENQQTSTQPESNLPNSNNSSVAAPSTELSGAVKLDIATPATPTYLPKHDFAVENVMPGIYLSKNFIVWNEENLHAHGFTHIIIIDKHIQELYYPSPIFKICAQSKSNISHDPYEDPAIYADYNCTQTSLNFGKEFEAIDLNFGEKSYLITVLPNCYRAVRFINKALQAGGTILVIDCNGGEQKCLTIIVAYLMYKHNISFSDAFARLKTYYKKADLDRFFISQLYEYEPILQVQRAQSRGHSCSREMHAAVLKRKKVDDESYNNSYIPFESTAMNELTEESTNLFLESLNPLAQFNANNAELKLKQQQKLLKQQQIKPIDKPNHSIFNHIRYQSAYTLKQQQTSYINTDCNNTPLIGGFNSNWDDNAME